MSVVSASSFTEEDKDMMRSLYPSISSDAILSVAGPFEVIPTCSVEPCSPLPLPKEDETKGHSDAFIAVPDATATGITNSVFLSRSMDNINDCEKYNFPSFGSCSDDVIRRASMSSYGARSAYSDGGLSSSRWSLHCPQSDAKKRRSLTFTSQSQQFFDLYAGAQG